MQQPTLIMHQAMSRTNVFITLWAVTKNFRTILNTKAISSK